MSDPLTKEERREVESMRGDWLYARTSSKLVHIIDRLCARVDGLEAAKAAAYNERDRCVAVVCALARAVGWPVWLATHEGEWEDEWRNIVFVETPAGQVSWHYHDSERPLFAWIGLDMPTPKPWDGHSTPEKYERLWRLVHDGITAALDAEPGKEGA
jgi:hypothetical protein